MMDAPPRRSAVGFGVGSLAGLFGYALRRAQLQVAAELADSLRPLDLRPATFSVLALIRDRPGLSQTEIGDLLGIQRANFVPLARALERMDWIERRPSSRDRRQNVLRLTPSGCGVLRRAWVIVRDHEARIGRRLGVARRREVLQLLDKLSRPAAPSGRPRRHRRATSQGGST